MTRSLVKETLQKPLLAVALAVPVMFLSAVENLHIDTAGIEIQFRTALAQDDDKPKRETRRAPTVSQKVNNKLAEISAFLSPEEGEPNLEEALRILRDTNTDSWNEYEKAQTFRMYGSIYVQKGDYEEAAKWFKRFVETPTLPEAVALNASYNLGQLYLATENYPEAVRLLQDYVNRSEIVGASQYFVLGQAYYLNQDSANAIKNVDEAVKRSEAAGQVPTEPMFNYQYVLYHEKEDYAKVISILEKVVRHYPKMSHWKTLAGVYSSADRLPDQRHAYDAIYLMGGLSKGSERMLLASLYLEGEYPYKAAKIIEKGIAEKIVEPNAKNLQTLGTAWQLARENDKSVEIYEQAAKISDDGELYARLADLYLSTDQLDKAIQSGKRALQRKLKKPAEVHMRIGMALFNQDKYDDALGSFQEARKDKTIADQARNWIKYTESEKERVEKLATSR